MTRHIVANWKSHKTVAEGEQWLLEFLTAYEPDPHLEVILAPSFIHLVPLYNKLQNNKIPSLHLAAQDVSPFPLGSYTGEMAAAMLQGLVDFIIVGHSERRRYFHETDQDVANKVSEAAAANIRPIVCVDQPYARSQMTALNEADMENMLIGYGPVEAIGVDIAQSPAKAAAAIEEIRAIAPGRPVLYGGSVNRQNAADYLDIEGVAGLMVGTASLDPQEFTEICRVASQK